MLAIPDEGVDLRIGIPEVQALLVGTGVPLGVDALGCSRPAFDLAPGSHRSRGWPSSRRGRGGESAGRAIVWATGLEQTMERAALGPALCGGWPQTEPVQTPKQRQTEKEADHEQEHIHLNGQNDPPD
jgi:hypothetical protein